MAKALINKGVPIKADNPKDPYIMGADGINEIVNANTTFGKTLAISGQDLSLKNGNSVLSTVTLPSGGGGGSSAGVSTYTATYAGSNQYRIDSRDVAQEIFAKLNNNEDVQIVLAKTNGNKIICRCFGYRPYDEYVADLAYLFASVVYDLSADGIKIYSFDFSGGVTLVVNTLDLSST